MANSIAAVKNYTTILDEVYQRAAVSRCLNSPRRMVRAGRNAKEIMIPKIEVSGLGNYTRNVGYKTGSITYEYETKTFNYDRGIRLLADVMDVEEAGVLDCFVEAGSELQRTQVAPEADAFTFAQIAGHAGVTTSEDDLSDADAADVLAELRAVTNLMDEAQVTTGSRYLFITPTLKGALDDFSLANPTRSNRVLERFSRVVEVPQVRFCSRIDLFSGDEEQFCYRRASVAAVEIDASVAAHGEVSLNYWFYGHQALAGVSGLWSLSGVREMRRTFSSCNARRFCRSTCLVWNCRFLMTWPTRSAGVSPRARSRRARDERFLRRCQACRRFTSARSSWETTVRRMRARARATST